MDDRNAQVGWTEAQWNRVRAEVLRAWQSVRVAASFIPAYGPLPPSTQVVPSEVMDDDGVLDERSVAPLLEISLPVRLSRQQVQEEDLGSALQQFRRRATQIGQLEDWFVFNGTYPSYPSTEQKDVAGQNIEAAHDPSSYYPAYAFLSTLNAADVLTAAPKGIAGHSDQLEGLRARNPGALGLFEGAGQTLAVPEDPFDPLNLIDATVEAITRLEAQGYVAPYACVLGRDLFRAVHRPIEYSVVSVRDRLEPLVGRGLLHTSALDVLPTGRGELAEEWQCRGVLLSVGGDAVDLAIAAEAAPEFRCVDERGGYLFAVFERFALRIKDRQAIVPLKFGASDGTGNAAPPEQREQPEQRKQLKQLE